MAKSIHFRCPAGHANCKGDKTTCRPEADSPAAGLETVTRSKSILNSDNVESVSEFAAVYSHQYDMQLAALRECTGADTTVQSDEASPEKMAGSIGDGENSVPTAAPQAAAVPGSNSPAPPPGDAAMTVAYAKFQRALVEELGFNPWTTDRNALPDTPPTRADAVEFGASFRDRVDSRRALEDKRQEYLERASAASSPGERQAWIAAHEAYVAGIRMREYETEIRRAGGEQPQPPRWIKPGTPKMAEWQAIDAVNRQNHVLKSRGVPQERWVSYPNVPLDD